jgi:hypothetical protein
VRTEGLWSSSDSSELKAHHAAAHAQGQTHKDTQRQQKTARPPLPSQQHHTQRVPGPHFYSSRELLGAAKGDLGPPESSQAGKGWQRCSGEVMIMVTIWEKEHLQP